MAVHVTQPQRATSSINLARILIYVFMWNILEASLVHSTLIRNLETCTSDGTVAREYHCLMHQNTLAMIMDNIRVEDESEYNICRKGDNGKLDHNEYYYESNEQGAVCIFPRDILIKGTMHIENIQLLSLHGALQACPETDPDFHECLCAQEVSDDILKSFSTLFLPFERGNFTKSCWEGSDELEKSRRDTQPLERLSTSSKVDISKRTDSSSFRVLHLDEWGRPVYDNGMVGQPLPYWDFPVDGPSDGFQHFERCFVHPMENLFLECQYYRTTSTTPNAARSSIYSRVSYQELPTTTSVSLSTRPTTTAVSSLDFRSAGSVSVTASGTDIQPTHSVANSADGSLRSSKRGGSSGICTFLILVFLI